MTPITGASGLLGTALAPNQKPGEDPRRVAAAAEQFEALLIGQMLKSVHESDQGGGPAPITTTPARQPWSSRRSNWPRRWRVTGAWGSLT